MSFSATFPSHFAQSGTGSKYRLIIYFATAIAIFALNLSLPFRTDHYVPSSTVWTAADGKSVVNLNFTDEEVNCLRLKVDSISQVRPEQIAALLLTEDQYFYTNFRGISIYGLGRFFLKSGGGSGLVQQLVKNRIHYFTERSIGDKLTELVGSVALTSTRSRDELLLDYINESPTMNTTKSTYGMRSASLKFFGKADLRQLTIAEWCVLTASLKGGQAVPGNIPGLTKRRNLILGLLAQHGHLKAAAAKKFCAQRIQFAQRRKLPDLYNGCKDAARREAIQIAKAHHLDTTLEGYTIVTTFSPTVQRALVDAVIWRFSKVNRFVKNDTVEVGCAAISPEDGRILGLVGDATPMNFTGNLNHADRDANSVGSQLKPFVYSVFLSAGNTPETQVSDVPGSPYNPSNYGGGCLNTDVSIRYALAHSINKCVANLINSGQVSTAQVIALLRAAGFTRRLHTEPALILGIDNASPLDMAMLYSIFPNGGRKVEPYCIAEIRDDNDSVLYQHTKTIQPRVLSQRVANDITECLKGVVGVDGTGASVRNYYQGNVAAKSGTSNVATDAWFSGYTSRLTLSIWVGTLHNTRLPAGLATGGQAAAPIFGKALFNIQKAGSYYLKTNF